METPVFMRICGTDEKNAKKALESGACNSAIARWMNENGFTIYRAGWDKVVDGHYYHWNNDSREYVLRDDFLSVEAVDDEPEPCHYRTDITPAVIATWKRMLR